MSEHRSTGILALEAVFRIGAVQRSLELGRGDAELLEGPAAPTVARALTRPDPATERLIVAGQPLLRAPLQQRVRAGLVTVGRDPVAPDVSVVDHLAAVTGLRRARDLVADAPLLAGRGGAPAGILSGGERRVLGFLRATALRPIVVILDRAGAGLDDAVLDWAGQVIGRWRDDGVAVVVHPSRPEERGWV